MGSREANQFQIHRIRFPNTVFLEKNSRNFSIIFLAAITFFAGKNISSLVSRQTAAAITAYATPVFHCYINLNIYRFCLKLLSFIQSSTKLSIIYGIKAESCGRTWNNVLTACSSDDHIILLYFTQKLLYEIKEPVLHNLFYFRQIAKHEMCL